MTERATVREVARDLGLSPRRVRQLVDENVLPPATEGTLDADLCRRRYRLFTRDPTADWTHVYDDAIALARLSDQLMARALGPEAELPDVAEACLVVQNLMADLRFITAVKSNTQSERSLFLSAWARQEHDILAALIARAHEIAPEVTD
ncbi:hypothetical protein WHZ78_16650 [Bradyrhizobium symbiodeficiens]|uniref:hypothetical protein n=1 Tax=Bradyrhizobium symbiodeficiens TaxID=1404367 RepID=UPI0030CBD610